jgi:cell wall-associated NlpC family hydrolase
MDRRLTPANQHVAATALQGSVSSAAFVDGTPQHIIWPVVDLLNTPEGHRDRQLLFGDTVLVFETRDGWAFVQADKDGYVGYVPQSALEDVTGATHWVSGIASHMYAAADIKSRDVMRLSFGSKLTVIGFENGFAKSNAGYVPATHVSPIEDRETDPATVAEKFLGTPYLWGGNSRMGIDCSGLIQAAFLACNMPCPADSDMQQDSLGTDLTDAEPLQRNDLLFWKGHVALVIDAHQLIHANASHMAVAYENTNLTIARIEQQGEGPVTRRARISLGDDTHEQ